MIRGKSVWLKVTHEKPLPTFLNQTMHKATLLFLALSALLASALVAGPGTNNPFGGKRVIVIGIDGLTDEAIDPSESPRLTTVPNFDALRANGTTTFNAYCGGDVGTVTEQPTISGPGWATIMSGVYANKHGIINNKSNGPGSLANYPFFFKYIKQYASTAHLSSSITWPRVDGKMIQTSILSGESDFMDFRHVSTATGTNDDAHIAERNTWTSDHVVEPAEDEDPDAIFVHLGDPITSVTRMALAPLNITMRSNESMGRSAEL